MGSSQSSEISASPLQTLPHLQLFNPDNATPSVCSDPAFHLFPLLPAELRLKIWRHSLERRRIIRIFIDNYEFHPDVKEADQPDEDTHCYAVAAGYQTVSKLFRVNSESRQATMEFYRVHIPCRLSANPQDTRRYGATEMHSGTLYFNPEYDFMHISSEIHGQHTLVEFLHRLKTVYDPRGVGLLNMAVDVNDLLSVDRLDPIEVQPAHKQSFAETLSQLRNVYFIEHSLGARICEGWRSGYCGDVFFNRSLPIVGTAPSFELLPRDPRPIAKDLRRTFVGRDRGRRAYGQLQDLFKTWGAEPKEVQYRLLVGSLTPGHVVSTRASADEWLDKEDEYWNWLAVGGKSSPGREPLSADINWPPLKLPHEDLQAVPRPAVGFWLFPQEAVTDSELGMGPLHDMTKYWPQLALTSLP
ncbi:hypothetical protein QBC34DRAFT_403934 [Podospora aff. communis PSN243]|uniref:2EXR domain-containing protein n=1 Tax=Podospora aff. communis PSN243 TaxID=3040156 RepID=A0AAV9GNH1_9PEZI|nr:hypothetical protein QBC34DRAFT_403934 [Podospora aff. communis PSN243]